MPRLATARALLASAIEEKVFPGAAFAVLCSGAQYLGAAGRFTYAPDSPAVTPHTIFDLASVSKVVATTAMAMLLYDRGLLALDSPLQSILPAFNPARDSARAAVTLRHLLTHSSGLPAHEYLYRECRTRGQALAHLLTMPLESDPGAAYVYSDPGFILLGLALEKFAAEPLDVFCTREIFAPLGMASTLFCPPAGLRSQIPPTGPDTGLRTAVIQGEVHDENAALLGGVAGHAGLFSNAPDLLRFAQCLFAGGLTSTGSQLFQPATIALFITPASRPPGSSRALGWDTPSAPSSSGHYFSPHSAGHLGFSGTSLWLDFDRRLAIALLNNRTYHLPDEIQPTQDAIRRLRPAFHDAVFQALVTAIPPL